MFLRQTRFLSNKIFKNSFRNCSVNAEIKADEGIEENVENKFHIYKKQMTKSEVVNFLAESVVYNKDGIIVTNKPYGVRKFKITRKIENYIVQTFSEITLEDVLPDLAATLGLDSLRLVKGPERLCFTDGRLPDSHFLLKITLSQNPVVIPYHLEFFMLRKFLSKSRLASGVTILATTDEAQEMASARLMLTKRRNKITDTYLTVCLGHPVEKNLNTKFGIKFRDKTSEGGPIIVDKFSVSSIVRKEVRSVKWTHDELSSSKHASLLKVQLSFSHKNSLRMYLATKCLSPVLGDLLYGSKVENVLGVPLLKDPSACVVGASPKIHPEMLSALQISENEVTLIPNMVHLLSVEIFFSKKHSTVVTVPPPDFFVWTCKQLGLVTDENFFNEKNLSEINCEN